MRMPNLSVYISFSLLMAGCSIGNQIAGAQRVGSFASDPKELAKGAPLYQCQPNVCDEPPRLVYAVPPIYPLRERESNSGGSVIVVFDVESSGLVSNTRVLEADSSTLAEAVFEAVRRWKYTPGMLNGKYVKVDAVEQKFKFEIDGLR